MDAADADREKATLSAPKVKSWPVEFLEGGGGGRKAERTLVCV